MYLSTDVGDVDCWDSSGLTDDDGQVVTAAPGDALEPLRSTSSTGHHQLTRRHQSESRACPVLAQCLTQPHYHWLLETGAETVHAAIHIILVWATSPHGHHHTLTITSVTIIYIL